jgi:hypothetical protein
VGKDGGSLAVTQQLDLSCLSLEELDTLDALAERVAG